MEPPEDPSTAAVGAVSETMTPPVANTNGASVANGQISEHRERVIKPGYRLRVTVIVQDKSEIDLNDAQVSESGELLLPLVKQVRLADLTMDEAAERLTELYAKYFKAPQVYVQLPFMPAGSSDSSGAASAAGYVAVTGRVRNPGLVAVPAAADLKVSEAILRAGGLNTSARDRAVMVTRRRPDGSVERKTVDLRAILSEGDLAADLTLQGGDVVYVPESLF